MNEQGCKFPPGFKWKHDEDGSLMFPEELKKFTERRVHKTENLPNQEYDLIFHQGESVEMNAVVKVRVASGSDCFIILPSLTMELRK
jgi:hypothetical protein